MASLRMNPELLKLAGLIEKNDRLSSYEKMRQAINAKSGGQAVPLSQDSRQSEMVQDNAKEKMLKDRFVRALNMGKATSSPDGETWTLFAEGKGFAGTPDMDLGEVEIDRPEFESNLQTVKQLLGKENVEPSQALLIMAKAKDKFGSVDPMKMRQILRYSSDDEPEVALPAKGSR